MATRSLRSLKAARSLKNRKAVDPLSGWRAFAVPEKRDRTRCVVVIAPVSKPHPRLEDLWTTRQGAKVWPTLEALRHDLAPIGLTVTEHGYLAAL
jgi:hypothetical protein